MVGLEEEIRRFSVDLYLSIGKSPSSLTHPKIKKKLKKRDMTHINLY